MKKILIFLCIFLIAFLVFVLLENRRMKQRIKEHQQEIEISSGYIEKLSAENRNLKKENEKKHAQNINEKLDKYLAKEVEDNRFPEVRKKELKEKLEKIKEQKKYFPDLIPVKSDYALSQFFSHKHPALDFAVPLGTEVIAAASGEVLSVYEDKYLGKVVMIDHLNEYATLYAHLAKIFVTENMSVQKGEIIGLAGNTGNSTAPHLHFEILKNGENINPAEILRNLK